MRGGGLKDLVMRHTTLQNLPNLDADAGDAPARRRGCSLSEVTVGLMEGNHFRGLALPSVRITGRAYLPHLSPSRPRHGGGLAHTVCVSVHSEKIKYTTRWLRLHDATVQFDSLPSRAPCAPYEHRQCNKMGFWRRKVRDVIKGKPTKTHRTIPFSRQLQDNRFRF